MKYKQSASARTIYFCSHFQGCWYTRFQIQRVFYVRKLLVCSIPFQWIIELGSSKIGRTQNRQGGWQFNETVLCCFKSYSEPTLPWDPEMYQTAGAQTGQSKSLDGPPSHVPLISHWLTQHLNQRAGDLWGGLGERQQQARMKGVTRTEMSRFKSDSKAGDAQPLLVAKALSSQV